jgi:hypothetical protein
MNQEAQSIKDRTNMSMNANTAANGTRATTFQLNIPSLHYRDEQEDKSYYYQKKYLDTVKELNSLKANFERFHYISNSFRKTFFVKAYIGCSYQRTHQNATRITA